MKDNLRPSKNEIIELLLHSIDQFPSYSGRLELSLQGGVMTNFKRFTSGNTKILNKEKRNPYARLEREEVIRSIEFALLEIGSWGKLIISFDHEGVIEEIGWNNTYDLLAGAQLFMLKKRREGSLKNAQK